MKNPVNQTLKFAPKIIGLFSALSILTFLVSCSSSPEAGFKVSLSQATVGEVIDFTSTSSNATYYQWSFGDGTYAITKNTSHSYLSSGNFTVTLIAIGDDKSSSFSSPIEIIGTVNIFPGEGIDSLTLGKTWGQVKSLFPAADTSMQVDTNLGTNYNYVYNDSALFGVECNSFNSAALDSADLVDEASAFEIWDNSGDTARFIGCTPKGVAVGNNLEAAKIAYGTGYGSETTSGGVVYYYDNLGIQFWTEVGGTQIIEIDVYGGGSEKSLAIHTRKHANFIDHKITTNLFVRGKKLNGPIW